MNTILFVGDNFTELKELCRAVSAAGFGTFICTTYKLWDTLVSKSPDIIIYDGKLETLSEITKRLGPKEKIPIIALAGVESLSLLGLNQDIDDFIVKPANSEELLQRVRRLLWKSSKLEGEKVVKISSLTINLESYQVYVDKELISLTLKEFELLKFLATHRGKVYTREFLLNQIWGYDYYGGMRTVDVHIRRLRSKIEVGGEVHIETVRGVGYRFR